MNIGVSALNANQTALQTISNNIANVNTAGYSRQTASLKTNNSSSTGNGYIGNGVSIAGIARNYSELLNRQSNAASAMSSADTARYSALNQMQSVFTGGDSSLGAAISSMLNSFSDVVSAPSDGTARNVALTRMNELASRFRSASDSLEEQSYLTKQQITNGVTQVNSLAAQVAALNGQISRAQATGQSPNDLLDARDQAIRQINKLVQTTQLEADDGSLNLFIGGSQPLVLGTTTGQLGVKETTEYPGSGQLSLYFSQPNGQKVEMSASMVAGGEIAGLLKFNNDDLVTGRNLLGRLALTVGTLMNEQNQLGLTLSGTQGSNLFKLQTSDGYSSITGYRELAPEDRATVTVANGSNLVASDYKVIYGSNPPADTKLVRLSDGMTRTIDGSDNDPNREKDQIQWDPATNSFVADGLRFTLPTSSSFVPQARDSILFQPYNSAAATIQAAVHNPDDLAVANAVSATIPSTNQGTLQLSNVSTTNFATIPAAQTPLQLKFLASGEIEVLESNGTGGWNSRGTLTDPNTSAPVLYASGKTIKLDSLGYGLEITLTGTPSADDTMSISNALDLGSGYKLNAGNATAFLALRDAKVFDDGTTLSDGFSSAMAVIGTRTQSAKYAATLSATVASNLDADRTSVSGVNLDEEAARLLQYQQAYQASAKIITIAQSLFDSVLSAMR